MTEMYERDNKILNNVNRTLLDINKKLAMENERLKKEKTEVVVKEIVKEPDVLYGILGLSILLNIIQIFI